MNYFEECDLGIQFDNRGEDWQNDLCGVGGELQQELISLNYLQPPWVTRKPELADITQMYDCKPVYNRIENNIYCKMKNGFINRDDKILESWLTIFNGN